jgi:hypothetical protein
MLVELRFDRVTERAGRPAQVVVGFERDLHQGLIVAFEIRLSLTVAAFSCTTTRMGTGRNPNVSAPVCRGEVIREELFTLSA